MNDRPEISLWDMLGHHWQNYLYFWMDSFPETLFVHFVLFMLALAGFARAMIKGDIFSWNGLPFEDNISKYYGSPELKRKREKMGWEDD